MIQNPTPPILNLQRSVPGGWIVLIGGGEFSFGETREIDEFLLSKLPEENRTIAFLPTASGSSDYAVHLARYFATIDSRVELVNVPIYRGRDVRRGKNLALLSRAGLIYIGGGVTNALLEVIRGSAAEEALRQSAGRGAIVVAIGAGAAALGRLARDMRRAGGVLEGLHWISDAAIETSFDPANDLELRRLMSRSEVQVGIGIPPGTALAISPDGAAQILGAGSVAVVRRAPAPVQ